MARPRENAQREPEAEALRIGLSGAYRLDSRFDALIAAITPLLELEVPTAVQIDFGGLVSIGPTGLALLTAAVKDARDRALLHPGVTIVPPRSRMVWNYLLRMDLFRTIIGSEEYDVALEGGEGFVRHENIGFRPCRVFNAETDYLPVTRELAEALYESCVTDEAAKASVRVCLDELAENVLHHAESRLGGIGAAQGWRKTKTFEVGIVDLGIGIRASLTKNPTYADIADDATAIETALRPRVTSTPERNSGIGLFVTRLLLRANGGFFVVRSGNAALYAGSQEEVVPARTPFPGTIVALRARTDRPLNIKQVYRRLDEEDGSDDDGDDVGSPG